MVSPLCLSRGKTLSVSWGKERGGGIPRARRDKDLKGAERMERRTGGIRPLCHRQAKAAGEGRQRRRHSW